MSGRHLVPCSVHVSLVRDGHVLLARRGPGLWASGLWNLPCGHLEAQETVLEAAIRETREEVGVTIDPEHLEFVHFMHRKDEGGEYLNVFFTAEKWHGQPINGEPEKCTAVEWFPLDALPDDTVPYQQQALTSIAAGRQFDVSRFFVGSPT